MISKLTLILPFSICMHHKQNKIEYTQNNLLLGAGKNDHLKPLKINHFLSDRKVIVFFSSCSKMMYANASVEITMEEKHNDLTEIIV